MYSFRERKKMNLLNNEKISEVPKSPVKYLQVCSPRHILNFAYLVFTNY